MDSPPQPGLTTLAYWRLDGFRSAIQRVAAYSGKFRRRRRDWKRGSQRKGATQFLPLNSANQFWTMVMVAVLSLAVVVPATRKRSPLRSTSKPRHNSEP